MGRPGPLAALTGLLLGACGPSRVGPGPALPDLQVTWELDAQTLLPREGDLATITFRVRNATPSVVVLRDLFLLRDFMLPGSTSAVASWQFSQPGLLTFSPERAEWDYERAKPGPRRPVFNSGCLMPKESILVRARVRLLDMPKDFQFTYYELSEEDVRRKLYFEVRKEREVKYRLLLSSELEGARIPSTNEFALSHRLVIFPHADPQISRPLQKSVRVQVELQPRPFTLAQAAARLGVPVPPRDDYTWSAVHGAWAIRHAKGAALVSPAAVRPLPEIVQLERFFYYVDALVPGKVQIHVKGDALVQTLQERRLPLVAQHRQVAIGPRVSVKETDYFLFMTAAELLGFLDLARELKLGLDVDLTAEGGGRITAAR